MSDGGVSSFKLKIESDAKKLNSGNTIKVPHATRTLGKQSCKPIMRVKDEVIGLTSPEQAATR